MYVRLLNHTGSPVITVSFDIDGGTEANRVTKLHVNGNINGQSEPSRKSYINGCTYVVYPLRLSPDA